MFSPTQMRAVAEKVYPLEAELPGHRSWQESKDFGGIRPHSLMIAGETSVWKLDDVSRVFDPSLTGNLTQRDQALQCIVAALKLGLESSITKESDYYEFKMVKVRKGQVYNWIEADPLTASIAALLASTPSAVESV